MLKIDWKMLGLIVAGTLITMIAYERWIGPLIAKKVS